MQFDEVIKLKTIKGLMITTGWKVNFKIKVLPTTVQVPDSDNEWTDGPDCFELHGSHKGHEIRSSTVFNQSDLDKLQLDIQFKN